MLNPCCCINPRIGALVFGIIDLVVGVSTVFWALKLVADSTERLETWIELGFAILLVFLAVLLLLGTMKNSADKLRLWIVVWLVVVLCFIAFQIFNVARVPWGGERYRVMSSLLGTLIFLYQIWVVYAFSHQLRYGPNALTYCPTQII